MLTRRSNVPVLGFLLTLLTERMKVPNAPILRLVMVVGFLRAYITFSTFEYETLAMAQTGTWIRAFGNAVGSVAAGFCAVWLGTLVAHAAPHGR